MTKNIFKKGIQCTFRYVNNSIQTNKFTFKFLKSRKNDTKCNKTHMLKLNVTEILLLLLPPEENQPPVYGVV